jgi:hypothetical protein
MSEDATCLVFAFICCAVGSAAGTVLALWLAGVI